MKKWIALLLTAVLALTLTGAAWAETPLRLMFDSAYELLFETNNVTLLGSADFLLDGERFKTAVATHQQQDSTSCWRLRLLTPQEDGTEKETGYTVYANGGILNVVEAYRPEYYKKGSDEAQTTILRSSVQMSAMTGLLRMLADQSDALLGLGSVTVTQTNGEMTVRIQAGEDVPELVNTALNLLAQYAVKRYFGTDYDFIAGRHMVPMANFITVTQAILYSTKSISLKSADVTLKRDSAGNLEQIRGSVSVNLHTAKDGTRTLKSDFNLEVYDLGSTKAELFDARELGVKLIQTASYMGMDSSTVIAPHDKQEVPESYEAWEKELWALAGYDPEVMTNGYPAHCWFDDDGTLLDLQDETAPWLNRLFEEDVDVQFLDGAVDAEKEAADRFTEFLSKVNPGMEKNIRFVKEWTCELEGAHYTQYAGLYEEYPEASVTFVVKTDGDTQQIQYFSCVSNG